MGVLKAFDGTSWRKVGCGGGPPGIVDNFNRTTSTILDRSDGGLWTCSDLTNWAIDTNRLTYAGGGVPTPIQSHWFYADYGYDNTVSVSCKFAHKYEASIFWWIATDPAAGTGYEVAFNADFPRLSVQPIGGGGAYFATATTPFGGDGVERTITITYNYSTGLITVGVNGTTYISATVPGTPSAGTGLALLTSRDYSFFGSYYDDVSVTGTGGTVSGRLRLQLPDSSWVREACDDDLTSRHPLKIEDPASPGTWITVACMVPV